MNKKIVVFSLFFLLIVILFFGGQGQEIKNLEKTYINNPTDKNLFELCKVALVDEDNDKIIEYFPLLITNPNFEELYNSNSQDGVSLTDFTNIYVDTYIFACYKELPYDDFKKQFIEIFPYFVFKKDSSSDYTVYLQTHFYKTFTIDKKTTKDYADVLNLIYEDDSLTKDLRIEGYDFIMEWYGLIGELESYQTVKQKKTSLSGDGSMIES